MVGNWKMNGDRGSIAVLLSGIRAASRDRAAAGAATLVVCPPYPYLAQAAQALEGSGVQVGAQDVSSYEAGAFTGEVCASMLIDAGCAWTLVGHSERRMLLGESDALVAAKGRRALAGGLGLIACVGETLEEREQGRTEAVLARQVDALGELAASARADRFVLAYEPVWAIGTGRTANPEQAQAAHAFIRARCARAGFADADSIRLLYGGSVKPSNAASLFAMPDIDGGLIGGASLVSEDFMAIARCAAPAA